MNDDDLAERRRRLGLPPAPIEFRDAFMGIDRAVMLKPPVWEAPTPQQLLSDLDRGMRKYPWEMQDDDRPPMHLNCRCVLTPLEPLVPTRRWPRVLLAILIGMTVGAGVGLLILLLVRACRR